MERKHLRNLFRIILNANLIVQYVIQIKNAIMKYGNVSIKIIVTSKMITIGILADVLVRIVSI